MHIIKNKYYKRVEKSSLALAEAKSVVIMVGGWGSLADMVLKK